MAQGAASLQQEEHIIKTVLLCVQDHTDTRRLDFLPHHFLLTSVGAQGVLRYQVSWSTPLRCINGIRRISECREQCIGCDDANSFEGESCVLIKHAPLSEMTSLRTLGF